MPTFAPGKNIALKIPAHEYSKTVGFYRDVLGFEEIPVSAPDDIESVTFKYGDRVLWLDKVSGISQAETWFEIVTDDIAQAAKYLAENNVARRDEIEPLPKGFSGFWVSSPANIIHLVNEADR